MFQGRKSALPAVAAAPSHAADEGQVSRELLAINPVIWFAFAGMFTVFAAGVTGFAVLFPSFDEHRLLPLAGLLLSVTLVALCFKPPPIGTKRNHVAIACVYVFTTIAMVAFQPDGLIPVGAAIFVGPFTAMRLRSRIQIAVHYALASISLCIPVALGLVDASAQFGVATVIPATWVLGFCVVIVLEAAETQGGELKQLVRIDPLTGVGNRRMLTDRLGRELERHAANGKPLSVAALDLNGFKALNDLVGHDAGDALLQRVAAALQAVSRAQDTVIRQGGDEFCILLPETSATEAGWVEAAIRTALADLDEGQTPITTGVGIATFPVDATDGDALLHVADTRLAADKASTARRPVLQLTERVLQAEPRPSTPLVKPGGLLVRVSRQELSVNPYTWFATGLMYSMFAAIVAGLCVWLPGNAVWPAVLAVLCVITATVMFMREPPALGTMLNQVVIAMTYVIAAVLLVTFPTAAGVAFGALAFIGPLAAVRLINRVQIGAHVLAATLIFVALVVLGLVDQTTALALLVASMAIWGLGFSCVVVLEAAERQGEQLEWLVRRDPLTGVGNRRALSEQLDYELPRHARTRRPLTVLALDLNGFKALNDDVGHAAGDQLLRDVAVALSASVPHLATVVRQGGDEYCVILPETTGQEAAPIADEIRARLAKVDAYGHAITTGIGVATFPADAVTEEALLRVADERLLESKQHGRPRAQSTLRLA